MGYRIEVIVKMQKKESRGRLDVIPVEQGVDQVGECVPRIKVIVKMPKKVWGRVGGCDKNSGVGGCDPRIGYFEKCKKIGGPVGRGWGGCEPRIYVIVKMQKSRGRVAYKYACTVNHSLDD